MNNAETWHHYFRTWPAGLAPTGIVVTSYGEQVPFESFQLTERLLLVNRRAPDTVGARRVIVPFSEIVAVKITEVVSTKALKDLGFEGPAAPPSVAPAKPAPAAV